MSFVTLQKRWSCEPKGELILVKTPHNRARVEEFIRSCFRREHGATPRHFAPHLVALTNHQQQIQACIGYQGAHEGALFLERYLDAPIEQLLSAQQGAPVARREIVEVGNLASRYPGCTRRIILSLARYFCCDQDYQWLVITATAQVRNAFTKMGVGLELLPLASARPERLGAEAHDWGRYYDEQPQVVAVRLGPGVQRLLDNPLFRKLMRRAAQPLCDQGIQLPGAVA